MECQRHLFTLPEDQHYLNCAYMSPLLKSVEAAGIVGLRRKVNPAALVPADFFDETHELRRLFARLVNTTPERVALVPAVSYGMAIASHNTRLRPGQNVVIPGEEFPSNVYTWMAQCQHSGARLRFVERPDQASDGWTTRLLDAIDRNTAVVTLSTVHWTDGTPFDVDRIGRRAREVGALFIVDGTQSIGAVPFDCAQVRPDLLVCAGYKWLFGPYQYCFAVVGDRLLDAEPFEHNWITRKNSQDFSALINYQSEFQPGAQRFDAGERSNFILVPMLLAALKQLEPLGDCRYPGLLRPAQQRAGRGAGRQPLHAWRGALGPPVRRAAARCRADPGHSCRTPPSPGVRVAARQLDPGLAPRL